MAASIGLQDLKDSVMKQRPYNKALKVYVVDVNELQETDRYKYVASVCDNSGCIKIFTNEKPEKDTTYLLYKYATKTTKAKNVYLTIDKRMAKTEANAPLNHMIDECKMLLNYDSPKKSITEAKSLNNLSTVEGTVIEDYEIKTVNVNGRDTTIKKLKIKDNSDDTIVAVWDFEKYNIDIGVGKYLQIKNVSPKKYGGNIELNSTRNTTIKIIEPPMETCIGKLVAYTNTSIVMNINEEYLELDVNAVDMPSETLLKKYIRHEEDLQIQHMNGKLVKIEEIEFPDQTAADWDHIQI